MIAWAYWASSHRLRKLRPVDGYVETQNDACICAGDKRFRRR